MTYLLKCSKCGKLTEYCSCLNMYKLDPIIPLDSPSYEGAFSNASYSWRSGMVYRDDMTMSHGYHMHAAPMKRY